MANLPFPGGPLEDEPIGHTSNDLVDSPTGSAGGGGLVLSPHTVDGDTLEHWELGTDGAADIDFANNSFDAGVYTPGYLPGSSTKNCHVCSQEDTVGLRGAVGAELRQLGAFTVATCLYTGPRPGGVPNQVIFRFAPYDQGADTEVNNSFYDLAFNPSTGIIRVFWENGAGSNNTDTLSLVLPENEWVHFVWTRNSDNVSGRVYVNDVFEEYTMGNAPTGSTNGELCLGTASTGVPSKLSFYSPIVKDIAASEAQVAAMQAEVGL